MQLTLRQWFDQLKQSASLEFPLLEVALLVAIVLLAIISGFSPVVAIPLFILFTIGFALASNFGLTHPAERAILSLPLGAALSAIVLFYLQLIDASISPVLPVLVLFALAAILLLIKKPTLSLASLSEFAFVICLLVIAWLTFSANVFPFAPSTNLPLAVSNDGSGNLEQIAYMVQTHSQYLAPQLRGGMAGALMAWNPASFSIPTFFALASGATPFQAKYLLLLLEFSFLALGAYLLLRQFSKQTAFIAALAVALPPVQVAFHASILGIWRLTNTYLYLFPAIYCAFKANSEKNTRPFMPIVILSSAVFLAHSPELLFLTLPLAILVKNYKQFDQSQFLNAFSSVTLLALTCGALLYFWSSAYLPGGAFENYVHASTIGPALPSQVESLASPYLGAKFPGLELLLPLALILLIVTWLNFKNQKSNQAAVFTKNFFTTLTLPLFFSIGLISAFQIYQIELRWPLLLTLLPLAIFSTITLAENTLTERISKYIKPIAIMLIIFAGAIALQSSVPGKATSQTGYALLQNLSAATPPNASIVTLGVFLNGEVALSHQRAITVVSTIAPNGDATIVENCFTGIRKTGPFSFTPEECLAVPQNICNYDYVFLPVPISQIAPLVKNLVEKSKGTTPMPPGLLVNITSGSNCV